MNILIVDDNEDSRMILKKTLESDGHTVQAAINGEAALKMAKKSPPDMIISDEYLSSFIRPPIPIPKMRNSPCEWGRTSLFESPLSWTSS